MFLPILLVFLLLSSSVQCDTWQEQLSVFITASAQAICVDINANRVSETRGYIGDIFYGFWDGFLNCRNENSNTDGSIPIPGTLYGEMAEIGHSVERGIYQILMFFFA
uniref:Secreted protein n=1 Tax=Caenorhabditis tropicalis TaxID=1561998 RepID=A0A1I7UTC4_9PELO